MKLAYLKDNLEAKTRADRILHCQTCFITFRSSLNNRIALYLTKDKHLDSARFVMVERQYHLNLESVYVESKGEGAEEKQRKIGQRNTLPSLLVFASILRSVGSKACDQEIQGNFKRN